MVAKAVKDWENLVREQGCIVTGQNDVQIHHVLGRTYKHNKVLIGPWYILPLCMRLHDVHSNSPFNVTHYPKRFAIEFGEQRNLFVTMCEILASDGFELPFNEDVIYAIADCKR